MSKLTKAYKNHARKRMEERHGEGLRPLVDAIKNGQYKSVERLTDSRSLCVSKGKNGPIWFIMNRKQKCPITILAPTYYKVVKALKKSNLPTWARQNEKTLAT